MARSLWGAELEAEFEEFVAGAWPRLRHAGWLLSHDSHEAEDLAQAALARAYANWGRVTRDGAYSYVHRSLVNGYIDSVRRRRPVPVAQTGDTAVAGDEASVDDRSQLSEVLAELSPRERSIIVWRYYLDAPESEVARQLGVSVGTVKSTASRALARVRSAHIASGKD
ncbi:sigma-70 family RNA polymerase sigma factor [Nocardioides sp.]|uniref:sigma-70 family RNA polymerase sigma factor n=1 Tax=Nocardioides sp. TaxID=35761 RepID=UPI002B93A432|nr:sigma-70 family RNA polymerase sigma factor [Nocardioides sp.]HXH79972.1 sigma-70 family RNA polymerase sigma factor [Nocardioides sp.]